MEVKRALLLDMGLFYVWLQEFIKVQKIKNQTDNTKIPGITLYLADVIFFKNVSSFLPSFHPWISRWFNEFTCDYGVDTIFFVPRPQRLKVKKVRFWHRTRRKVYHGKFNLFRIEFYPFIDELFGEGLLDAHFSLLVPDLDTYELTLFSFFFAQRAFYTPYLVAGLSFEARATVTKSTLPIWVIAALVIDTTGEDTFLHWIDNTDALAIIGAMTTKRCVELFSAEPIPSPLEVDMSTRSGNVYNIESMYYRFVYTEFTREFLDDEERVPETQFIFVTLEPRDWMETFTPEDLEIELKTGLKFLTVDQPDAKSFTMRTRQFYRTGVLWCLALTLLTILGPYYIFYGLNIILTYWWAVLMLFFTRAVAILFWRNIPARYKYRIALWI